jgi:quercetin dioxygenase-like cupin family protein
MKSVPWDDVPVDRLKQGIRRRIVTGEQVMLGRLTFPKGSTVPAHTHPNEQITHVLTGSLKFVIDGADVIVRAGETLHIPADVKHSAEALEDTDEIDAFSPIRTDWLDGSDAYLREEE